MKTRLRLYLLWAMVCVAYSCFGDGYYTEFEWTTNYVQELATGTGASGSNASAIATLEGRGWTITHN